MAALGALTVGCRQAFERLWRARRSRPLSDSPLKASLVRTALQQTPGLSVTVTPFPRLDTESQRRQRERNGWENAANTFYEDHTMLVILSDALYQQS